ncbi:MAG: TolC family protein [Pseudomonadota bacterium]|nr:TolC family protein [Pseudomonadota bacterium]
MRHAFSALALAGLAFLAGAGTGDAQPAEAQVRAALESAPAVAAARADRAAALARAEQTGLGGYETSLDAGLARREVDASGDSMEWQLGVSRRFRWPEKRRLDAELSRTETALAEAAYAHAWQAGALDWAGLWVRWDRARILEDVMANRADDARTRRDAERARLDQARGRAVDVDRLGRDLALAEAALETARQETELARLALDARFAGTARPDLAAALVPEACGGDGDSDPLSEMLQASPALRTARLALDHARLVRRRAEYDRRTDPQLGLQVFSERDGRETGVGVTVSMPIAGGLRAARVDEAAGNQNGRRASLAAVEAEARRAALELAARNIRTERRLQQARDAVAAAEQVLARLERGRDLQAVTVLDILEARSALWSAREAEIDARADRLEVRLHRGIRLGCVLGPENEPDAPHIP